MSQAITPELRQWILAQVAAGHGPEAVLKAMTGAGWQDEVALTALETLSHRTERLLQLSRAEAGAP